MNIIQKFLFNRSLIKLQKILKNLDIEYNKIELYKREIVFSDIEKIKRNRYLKKLKNNKKYLKINKYKNFLEENDMLIKKLTKIDDHVASLNNTFKFYLNKAYDFLNDILVYREKINSNEEFTEFKNEYRDVNDYLANGTIKNENFLLFEKYYHNLEKYRLLWNSINENFILINEFYQDINFLKNKYIDYVLLEEIKNDYVNVFDFFRKEIEYIELQVKLEKINTFIEDFTNLDNRIEEWNKEFITRELIEYRSVFDNVDNKSLDEQQRIAVVTNEKSNLIVAGAGSGKTLTISAKVKYLVDRMKVNPEEILLLSFTNKAANEMTERINNKLNINLKASTFHKLGLDILSQNGEIKKSINDNLDRIIIEYFEKYLVEDEELLNNVIEFYSLYLYVPKDVTKCKTMGEYFEHNKSIGLETLKPNTREVSSEMRKSEIRKFIYSNQGDINKKITIKNEQVKSLEEIVIANFLFINGINYEYESSYKVQTASRSFSQYKPDFYLPDYDIYIEHFGVNENMECPQYNTFQQQKYKEGMLWKRNLHRDNNTKLIETYSYEYNNGIILENLKSKLKDSGVKLEQLSKEEVNSVLFSVYNQKNFKQFRKLIETFIHLFKSNGYSVKELENFKYNGDNSYFITRTRLFFNIIRKIYIYYQNNLNLNNEIDFDDMINEATNLVNNDHAKVNYKYIIVDEFQDISVSRYNLIRSIIDKKDSKFVGIGDDWQSIYRFTGSDLSILTNFHKFFGTHKLLKIEKTYRNSQQLINTAGSFVMKNKQQIKKDLKTDKLLDEPIKLVTYKDDKVASLINCIKKIVLEFGTEKDILLLGRNNFDIRFIDESYKFEQKNRYQKIIYKDYPELKIQFMTVHSSKGLEADNVILLNSENSLYGFPNKLADDPLLQFVSVNAESFEYAEERRLFYVALTRTKNRTFILTPVYNYSVFIKELIRDYNIITELGTAEENYVDLPDCPKCRTGKMTIRVNEFNRKKFLGCTNYPLCDYTINDLNVINNQVRCTHCGGYYVYKKGRYGSFYGCSNYDSNSMVSCSNTMNYSDFRNIIK